MYKVYKVSRGTMYNRLLGKHGNSCGRPTVFSKTEEKAFVQHLLLLAEFDMPIIQSDVRACVKYYLEERGQKFQSLKIICLAGIGYTDSQRTTKYFTVSVSYIGSVLQVLDGDNFRVKFMSQYNNRHNVFIYRNVDLIENVANENIISILPCPVVRKGKHTFPYNVL